MAPAPKEPPSLEGLIPPPEKEFIPLLTDDVERKSLREAVENSLAYLQKKISSLHSPDNISEYEKDLGHLEKARRSLSLFREILLNTPDPAEFARRIQERFRLWETSKKGEGLTILLTGYYEPIIAGSLKPGGEYQYPIYRRPNDLVETASTELPGPLKKKGIGRVEGGQVVPYYSRQEIDSREVLKGKGYELAWLKDPWERFVLHVQGSGRICLPDGKVLRLGFDISNGRPYRSIGRYLVEQGLIAEEELSLRRVKELLQIHPRWMEEIFNINQRYIFFRSFPFSNQIDEGPVGALGVPLTAGRSIATDHSIFPPGALAYLISRQPVFDEQGKIIGRKSLRRFVLNQDTGAAMKGPARVDLYCGSGEKAGWVAGEMREEGKIYFLLTP